MPIIEFFIELFCASAGSALLTPETYGKTRDNPPKWWQLLTKQRIRRAGKRLAAKAKAKETQKLI